MKVGDTFTPVGSMPRVDAADGHEDQPFTIVGVLKHTGTPNDRVLFMNMEGFFHCPSHSQGATFAERLLGGPADHLLGRHFEDLVTLPAPVPPDPEAPEGTAAWLHRHATSPQLPVEVHLVTIAGEAVPGMLATVPMD